MGHTRENMAWTCNPNGMSPPKYPGTFGRSKCDTALPPKSACVDVACRTLWQIGAFLTSSAGCVVVDYPSRPDPPYVAISAPSAVGYCDDLMLEGSATFASVGTVGGWVLLED